MPQILSNLIGIALEQERDVVAVTFGDARPTTVTFDNPAKPKIDPKRRAFISLLKANRIGFRECYPPWAADILEYPYDGTLYIDVAPAKENPAYQILSQALEHPDGTLRDPHIRFWLLKLADAKARSRTRGEFRESEDVPTKDRPTPTLLRACEIASESVIRNSPIRECFQRSGFSSVPHPPSIEAIRQEIADKEYIVGSWLEHSKKDAGEAPWGIEVDIHEGRYRVYCKVQPSLPSTLFDNQFEACAHVILNTVTALSLESSRR